MLPSPPSGLGLLARLQTSGRARRTYPVPVGVALARLRAERAWRRRPRQRQDARAGMELLVGRTARAGEIERLAREHLYETAKYEELVWRTDTVTRLPVRQLENLRPHAAAGTGVLLSVVHQGQFAAHAACIARHGLPITVLIASSLFGEQPPTFAGLYRRQLFEVFSTGPDVTVLEASDSYAKIRTLLQAGRTVLLACDRKGSTPVRFLGRTVCVPSGTARLSLDTGAPIVPVSVVPDGRLERLELQPALLPAHYGDHTALLQAVFDRHAPAVLAWPQAVERPSTHFFPTAEESGGQSAT